MSGGSRPVPKLGCLKYRINQQHSLSSGDRGTAVGRTIVCPESDIFISMMTYHLQFLLLGLAGWVNRHQQAVIDYVREENA